jgi:uncharacterized protein (TIGR02246 family)
MKRRTLSFTMACVTLASLIARGSLLAQSQTPRQIVDAQNQILVKAVAAQDAIKAGTVYTKDAVWTGPGDRIHTRDNIVAMWRSLFEKGVAALDLKVSDVDLANGIITERGTFAFTLANGTSFSHGLYDNRWVNEDGQWRLQKNAITPAQ